MKLAEIVPQLAIVVVSLFATATASASESHGPIAVHSRGDLVFLADRGGELLTVDAKQKKVIHRQRIADQLSDLLPLGDQHWLASDPETGLVLLERQPSKWRMVQRSKVPYVVNLGLHPDRQLVSATCLWSRRVVLFDYDTETNGLSLAHTIDLPFAPRCQCWFNDGQQHLLLVVDSFQGRFAIANADGKLLHLGKMNAHNVRGLLVDDERRQLLVSHQSMNGAATTEHESIFWGGVITSRYSRVTYSDLLDGGDASLQTVYPLSTPGDAAADPGPLVALPKGGVAVALTGVRQLGLRLSTDGVLLRRNVGFRPQAVAYSKARDEVYVASTLSHRLTIVPLAHLEKLHHVRLRPAADPLTQVERGERLFYDGRLSLDGWFSCHSCHTDGHANGMLNDNMADGNYGHAKRIPSLLGVANSAPWAWNGGMHRLTDQVTGSVKTTMRGKPLVKRDAEDLSAFLGTLRPPPGIAVARQEIVAEDVVLGKAVFSRNGCIDCHAPPFYTSEHLYDVGIHDGDDGTREFNPPSLLGVSQRSSFFHDGRGVSLDEVLQKFRHGQEEPLADRELRLLLAFLRSL
ncbi:MAG: cytochrome c peroxidase [Pirellulaceae bacterium]